ncbi:MAG: Vps62-related protein [Deltaproteobacteria bacterium]|nr:Vps62-related protein [Deltaproteobacteria bacterium]
MRLAVLLGTLVTAGASLAVGCGGASPGGGGEDTPDAVPPFVVTDPTDTDRDGIPEQLEDYLMARFGPELRLAPDGIDGARPANVDWYLPKVRLRFDHPGCPDDSANLLNVGAITFDNLYDQTHYTKATGTGLCRHNDQPADLRDATKRHLEFFLQAENDELVHAGIPAARQAEWRAYVQVRPSSYARTDGIAAAYDLQVWYFFAYNDNVATANHEADWEHMTISITADYAVASVFYATHDAGHRIDDLAKLAWFGDHVVGYVADGSHATYESAGDHPGPVVDDRCYEGGPVWTTWTNFVNVGDLGHVLHDQTWARYGGRWGEVGETSFTSGPPGPMFQRSWDTATEY